MRDIFDVFGLNPRNDVSYQELVELLTNDPDAGKREVAESYRRLGPEHAWGLTSETRGFLLWMLGVVASHKGPISRAERAVFDGLYAGQGEPEFVDWPILVEEDQRGFLGILEMLLMQDPRPEDGAFKCRGEVLSSRVDKWLHDGATRTFREDDRRRLVYFERRLIAESKGRASESSWKSLNRELRQRRERFGVEHPATIRIDLVLSRIHINEGEYDQAYARLREISSADPRAEGLLRYVRQLLGCFQIIHGDIQGGLELLEKIRLEPGHTERPSVGLETGSGKLAGPAVVLLGCFAAPMTVPVTGTEAYTAISTLLTLRGLASKLGSARKKDQRRMAKLVQDIYERWSTEALNADPMLIISLSEDAARLSQS